MLRQKVGAVDVYLDPANAFLLHEVIKWLHGSWQYFFRINMTWVHLHLVMPETVEFLRNCWAAHVQLPKGNLDKYDIFRDTL